MIICQSKKFLLQPFFGRLLRKIYSSFFYLDFSGNGSPLRYSSWRIPWTEEPVDYSPWCYRESDMTERLTTKSSIRASRVSMRDFPSGSVVENHLPRPEIQMRSLGLEDPLEKEMAAHSSVLARGIP